DCVVCKTVNACTRNRDRYSLPLIRARLALLSLEGAIEQLKPVEFSSCGDTLQFLFQLVNFRLQCFSIRGGIGCICRLYRKLAHSLNNVSGFSQRALSNLRERYAVIGVPYRLIQAANLRGEALGDRQAS